MAIGNSIKDRINTDGLMQSMKNSPAPSFPMFNVEEFKNAIAAATTKAVKEMLEERQRKFKEDDKANGRLYPEDYMAIIGEYYERSINVNEIFLKEYEKIGDILKRDIERNNIYNKNLKIATLVIEEIKKKLIFNTLESQARPSMPKKLKELPLFMFRDYPLYWIKRIYNSKYVRRFVFTISICIYVATIGLVCFIARDNSEFRKDKEKNTLIRITIRNSGNKEAIQMINYIDMLYADKQAHQKEIQELWK